MIAIWPIYKSLVKMDLAVAGLIAAVCITIGEGLQLWFGLLAEKGYRKILIMLGVLLTSTAIVLPYASPIFVISLICFATAIGSASFHPPATGLLSQLSPNKKGLAITFFYTGGSLGMACSPLIFSQTYRTFHGHTWPILLIPLFLFVFLYFHDFPERSKGKSELSLQTFKNFFRQKELLHLYWTQVATQTVYWSFVFLLPDILLTKNAPEWIAFGGGHLAMMLGSFLLMLPAGHLSDRYTSKRVLLCASGCSIVLLLIFLGLPFTSPITVLPFLFVLGGALGVINPVAVALGNKLAPDNPSMISACLMGLVWCVAESLGPGISGVLTKFFSAAAPIKAMQVMAAFFIWGFYSISKLPQEEKRLASFSI